MSPVTVACVLRKSQSYNECHVMRLKDQVAEHMPDSRFVCLSDVPVPCERIPLITDWPGWWAKIELFRPGVFSGRVLYLDLDVSVVGELRALTTDAVPFIACREFNRRNSGINSSVMSWTPGPETDAIYNRFNENVMDRMNGDQNWITYKMPDAEFFPYPLYQSFKYDCDPLRHIHPDARVIVFHGEPKPWDLPEDHWIGQHA